MRLINVGYNWYFNNSCKIVFPKTDAGFRLYVFHSPVILKIDGNIYNVAENNAIIMRRGEAHQIYSESDTVDFMLDWVEFDMNENDLNTIEILDIPFNKVLNLVSGLTVSNSVMNLGYIRDVCQNPNQSTYSCILTSILLILNEIMIRDEENSLLKAKYPEIVQLRFRIREQPQLDWTLEKMSEFTHFSVSRLQHLYQQIFSVTCKEEVMICRIKKAEHLLISTTLSVMEISNLCGFHSYEHFSNTFKKRAGCSPTKYREQHLSTT